MRKPNRLHQKKLKNFKRNLQKKRAKKLIKKLAKKRQQNDKDLAELLSENQALKTENTGLKQQNTLNRLELTQVKTNMARMEVEIEDLKERLDNEITPTPKCDCAVQTDIFVVTEPQNPSSPMPDPSHVVASVSPSLPSAISKKPKSAKKEKISYNYVNPADSAFDRFGQNTIKQFTPPPINTKHYPSLSSGATYLENQNKQYAAPRPQNFSPLDYSRQKSQPSSSLDSPKSKFSLPLKSPLENSKLSSQALPTPGRMRHSSSQCTQPDLRSFLAPFSAQLRPSAPFKRVRHSSAPTYTQVSSLPFSAPFSAPAHQSPAKKSSKLSTPFSLPSKNSSSAPVSDSRNTNQNFSKVQKVIIYGDSNYQTRHRDLIQAIKRKNPDAASTKYDIKLVKSYTLERTYELVKTNDHTGAIVIINVLTNNARRQNSLSHVLDLQETIILMLKQETYAQV